MEGFLEEVAPELRRDDGSGESQKGISAERNVIKLMEVG